MLDKSWKQAFSNLITWNFSEQDWEKVDESSFETELVSIESIEDLSDCCDDADDVSITLAQ